MHLLVYALERKLTGTIELATPSGDTAAILFIDGQPSKARTSEAVSYLGRVFLELGYIDDATLDKSLLALSQTRRLHGQILLESGSIDEPKLLEGLRVQLIQKLRHTFTLPPETTFAYYDSFDSLHSFGGDDIIGLDPLPLVWAAVREAPPWEHVHAALTRVAQMPLRVSSKAELARFQFQPKELELIDMLRARPMRIADLAATELLKPREAQLLVYCLLITKQVQVVQDGAAMPPHLEPTPPQSPSPSNPPNHANELSFSLRAAVTTAASFVGPRPPATRTPPPPVSVSMKRVSVKPPPLETTPMPRLSPAAVAALPADLAARRAEILERAATIDREDYFLMLDLDRDASPDDVRGAFFALAKTWHPDRLPPRIADVRDACSRVFARLSEAHQTLSDPERRRRYMNLMTDGGATPEAQATIASVIEAATNFQKAEICLRRADYPQAEQLCKKAHEADPDQPDYLAMLAWLYALKPENQGGVPTLAAIARLDKAISISNRCERAHFYRGSLYKRLGNASMAAKDFRRAYDLNPRNIDAAREVRLHDMRVHQGSAAPPKRSDAPIHDGTRKPSDKSAGLFGKLFKK